MQDLISPSDLIALSWDNFVKHIRSYSEFAVWIIGISLVQFVLITVMRQFIDEKSVFTAIYFLASLPASVVITIVGGGMIDFTANAIRKRSVDVRQSLGSGAHHVISLIWISILSLGATLGGFLLFIVPMFIFFVWFKFASYHLFTDGIRGTSAMKASKSLVTGRWWPVLWRIAVPTVFYGVAIYFVIMLAYLVIGSVLGDPRMFFGESVNVLTLSTSQVFVTTVIPQCVGAFGAALALGSELSLFFDLQKRS